MLGAQKKANPKVGLKLVYNAVVMRPIDGEMVPK